MKPRRYLHQHGGPGPSLGAIKQGGWQDPPDAEPYAGTTPQRNEPAEPEKRIPLVSPVTGNYYKRMPGDDFDD
jgi:hypothetical protein